MNPVFLALVILLGAVFVYATRRAMRQNTFNLPTPQDAAQELEEAAAAREDGMVRTASGEPVRYDAPASERGQGGVVPSEPAGLPPLDAGWGRQPSVTPPRAPHLPTRAPTTQRRPLQTAAALPGRRSPSRAQAMFGDRAGLRYAVVAMTVLGPCRALDPYTPERGEPSPKRRA
ncbi:MAG: hypothetical protein Q8N06_11380 [Hydrogenophaga sp.]|nr:hypothetical protein [Hydrogenophaga sp.]